MKHLLLTTIAAVLVVGCGESQQSAPQVEPVAEVPAQPSAPPVQAIPVEPVAEATQPKPPTAKAPAILIAEVAQPVNPMADRAPFDAAKARNIEALKQHLADGAGCVDLRGLLLCPQPT